MGDDEWLGLMCPPLCVKCSFCHKPNTDVKWIVAAAHAAICFDCIEVAIRVVCTAIREKDANPRSVALSRAFAAPVTFKR